MKAKNIIGLIGFGVVGEGVYHVIEQTPAIGIDIKRIGIRQAQKERKAPADLFTTDINSILNDREIQTIVELIDDADEAFHIVKTALQNGKNVVTANKKMLAIHLPELIALQNKHQVALVYEAAVCGSIPILRQLESYYNNEPLQSIRGIVNGSTNYILTQMTARQLSYEAALQSAQDSGFAESDPALDVEGFDAQNKLTILLKHTFGQDIHPQTIFRKGITSISSRDIRFAKQHRLHIKLMAKAFYQTNGELTAYVMPQFVNENDLFHHVQHEFNAVQIKALLAGDQFLQGKGAGRYPTASAVLSDLLAISEGYQYSYSKSDRSHPTVLQDDVLIDIFISSEKHNAFNKQILQEVSTSYADRQGEYVIGKALLKDLFPLADRTDISLIELAKAGATQTGVYTNTPILQVLEPV